MQTYSIFSGARCLCYNLASKADAIVAARVMAESHAGVTLWLVYGLPWDGQRVRIA